MEPKTSEFLYVIQCVRCVCAVVQHLLLSSPFNHLMCVVLGEDMAYEHVHPDAAGMHRGSVGGEVYSGIPGIPLHPHHDSATAPPHPLQDF